MTKTITPTDGMTITESVRLAPGVYDLPHGITLAGDDITLEGPGALLVGREHTGVGVHAGDCQNVTIRDLAISGYYHGVRADQCQNLTLRNLRIRDTFEIEGIETFLYLWTPIEEVYGAAILLHEVQGGTVRGCDVQHQMNGLLLYSVSELTVEHNNASFNSGWGVYLSHSSDNVIQNNQLDFCNRVFRRADGSVRVEADSAGIVLVYHSSRNKFLRNSCLCGGDGIFVAGYDHKGHQGPCNDNLFEENDCRLSPNNAIESTFSRGNVFRRNDCSRSNYGLWMGYSWDNVIEDNLVEFNRWVGIAVEHGHDFVIRDNKIRLNGEGIRLWTRGGPVVQHWPGHEVSYNFAIEDNLIEGNRVGFVGDTGEETPAQDSHHFTLTHNTIRDNRIGVQLGRVRDSAVVGNRFEGNVAQAVRLAGAPGVTLENNTFEGNAEDVGKA